MTKRTNVKGKIARSAMVATLALSLGLVPLTGCAGTKKSEQKPAATQTNTTDSRLLRSDGRAP